MLIGVISDTHGFLRPEAIEALRGVEQILHAGDIEDPYTLEQLSELAPVTAVRGNCDTGELRALPLSVALEWAGVRIFMLHIQEDLDLDPATAGFQVVIVGHTHQPRMEERQGVLYLNPGSAGPRRFKLPVSLARLRLEQGRAEAEIVQLFKPI
ncbi:metallophosphoesterase [bacterium CPR1]|nr:metallophosphoesterase [bacterium CPR1]